MLVLTRKPNEDVVIQVGAEEIIVRLVDVDRRRDKARLGFIADPRVRIDRREIAAARRRGDTQRVA